MSLEEIKEGLNDVFCGNISIEGLVSLVEGADKAEYLKRINETGNYKPISYDAREPMVFFIINDLVKIDEYRNFEVPFSLVLITSNFKDLRRTLSILPKDQAKTVDMNSISVYYKYFERYEDKPFEGYAFEISLTTNENILEIND